MASLLERLGGRDGVAVVIAGLVGRIRDDVRLTGRCARVARLRHEKYLTEYFAAVPVLVAARATTYELLELAFEDAREAADAFCWLSRLAIVDQTPRGLRPHTLYRKCCERELARHAPQIWEHARRVVREFTGHRIAVASDPFHWVLDRLFVDRDLAAVREHVELPATDHGLTIERARREDRAAILEVAAATSGEAAIVGQWLDDEGAEIDVLRDADGAVRGYLCNRVLGAASPASVATPAIALASQHLRAIDWFGAATPPDATAIVFRCGRVAGPPLAAKLGHAMLLARMACRLLETPALEYLFVVATRPDRWRRLLRFLGVEPHPLGEVGRAEAKRTVLAAHWRPFSIAAVLDRAAAASERADLAGATEDAWPALASTSLSAMITQRIADLARATGLSRREQEVLHLLVLGRSTAEIGIALHITARTARFHQTNVLEKIGAESRLDVIRLLM